MPEQMSPDSKYPIAETFTSVQGEGTYTGTLMYFVRLAGCNVGRYVGETNGTVEVRPSELPLLQSKAHSICENVFGERFVCDTDYHRAFELSAREIAEAAGKVNHVCITGGEPFLHDLRPIVRDVPSGREIHIETSGTLPIPDEIGAYAWVTCSPKRGFLEVNVDRVDEWKFVVAAPEDFERILSFCSDFSLDLDEENIFVQPINNIHSCNEDNTQMVLRMLQRYPYFRLSAQLHKYLGVR